VSEPERHDVASAEFVVTCACGEQIVAMTEEAAMSEWEAHAVLALFDRAEQS
jgi:hypothetical protein